MGNRLRADCRLWLGVATVGESPSHTGEYERLLESEAGDKHVSCIFPSLAPPTQTARRVALPR